MLNVMRRMLPGALQKWLLKGWLRLERHLPMPARSLFWNDFSLFGKPRLGYLEAHLVDHCNLNCRGCSHFAPLAKPFFVAPDDFERDMRRLSVLFGNIRVIRLMGGEPLLHPEVDRFLSIARAAFPVARIHLVTNGLLLADPRESFWLACRQNRVIVDVTVYPPVQIRLERIRALCHSQGVSLRESPNSAFCARMNFKGDSPLRASFSHCRNLFFCPVLKAGKLYVCAPSAYVGLFNARYGTHEIGRASCRERV